MANSKINSTTTTSNVGKDQQEHREFLEPNPNPGQPGVGNQDAQPDLAAYEERDIDIWTVAACVALAVTYEACLFSFVLPSAILLNINAAIGPSPSISWVATTWPLSAAVVTTIAGRCSDIFGRRNFLIIGNALSLVGGCVACRATSVGPIIAGMTLMGVGAGHQQIAFAAANEIVPRKWRGTVSGLMQLAALPGSAFGSVIAYAVVANLSWRWAFYLGVLANGVALLLIVALYWPPTFLDLHQDGKTRLQQIKELDWIGLLLFGGGLTSFLLGISWGDNPYSWASAHVLVPLIVGALTVMVAFPLWEVYGSDSCAKLCPPALFKNIRGFSVPLVVTFLGGMMYVGLQVLWPQEVQLLFTTVPKMVGWYSLAYNASLTVGALVTGTLFAFIKKTNYQYLGATIMQAVFITLMATVNQHTSGRAIAFVTVAAFAVGAQQIIGLLIIQLGAEDHQIGVATGIGACLRATGGAIAISIYSSILASRVKQNLAGEIAAAVVQAGLPPSSVEGFLVALASGSELALESLQGITPQIIGAGIDAMRSVYADAFRMVFLVSLAFGGTACVAAAFVSSVDHKLTKHIAARVHRPHLLGRGDDERTELGDMEKDIDAKLAATNTVVDK